MSSPRARNRILSLLDRLGRIAETAIVVVMLGLVIILFLNVLLRYIASKPLYWSEELSLFGIVFITYIGGAVLVKNRKNVTISILVDALNEKARAVIGVIIELLTLFVICILGWQTLLLIPRMAPTVTPTIRISEGLYPIIAGIGYLLMIFFQLNNAIRAVLGDDGNQKKTGMPAGRVPE
jgi:TRAP-type C4-dicarboxylate transport system permease small subunit